MTLGEALLAVCTEGGVCVTVEDGPGGTGFRTWPQEKVFLGREAGEDTEVDNTGWAEASGTAEMAEVKLLLQRHYTFPLAAVMNGSLPFCTTRFGLRACS